MHSEWSWILELRYQFVATSSEVVEIWEGRLCYAKKSKPIALAGKLCENSSNDRAKLKVDDDDDARRIDLSLERNCIEHGADCTRKLLISQTRLRVQPKAVFFHLQKGHQRWKQNKPIWSWRRVRLKSAGPWAHKVLRKLWSLKIFNLGKNGNHITSRVKSLSRLEMSV